MYYPIVDLFPIIYKPCEDYVDIAMAKYNGTDYISPPPIVYNDHTEVVEVAANDHHQLNRFADELRNKLKKDQNFKDIIDSLPKIKDKQIKEIYNYRNIGFSKYPRNKYNVLNNQIHSISKYLAINQILFHGGGWFKSTPIEVGDSFVSDRPISFTFCPQIAAVHSLYHSPDSQIWIGKVTGDIKGYVFNYDKRENNHNELEILVQSQVTFTCSNIIEQNDITIVEFNIDP